MSQQPEQPLKLKNPTSYHLMQTNGSYGTSHSPHPLAPNPFHFTKDSPSEHTQNQIEFHDSFSQHMMHPISSPLSSEYEDHTEYQHLYDQSSTMPTIPMDIHRRSSNATDISLQHNGHPTQPPLFVPGSSFESTHSLAMSAPANMGYEYNYHQHPLGLETTPNNAGDTSHGLAKSYEDDYTAQLNMQMMMEKRRRRRESHNAGMKTYLI
ncbi:hypothetical protein EDC96DRAFT_128329 [Choanephora cucurbitarum]|nr:hypothetical protein EDC96DRAFT_128329 [Choanephora cucurbitarum]